MNWPCGPYGRATLQVLAGLALAGVLAASPGNGAPDRQKRPKTDLTISGYNTISFRQYRLTGNEGLFRDNNYGLDSSFDHATELFVNGRLYKELSITASFSQSRFLPNRSRICLRFEGNDATVTAGDLTANLAGNEFVLFNKTLQGIKVDSKMRKGMFTLLASQTKAEVRTDQFYGRNISGPYYLTASPVVDGSEVVKVDDQVKVRGIDYTIDYEIGILNFDPSIIIPPSSLIVVSYEYEPTGSRVGKLYALRASYPISEKVGLGATYLTVIAPKHGGGGGELSKQDRWLGDNTPGPFTLSYRPIVVGSEVVKVEGILQVRDQDYRINYTDGTITFFRVIPRGAMIVVDYRISQVPSSTGGDESVLGLDCDLKLTKQVSLNAQYATSSPGRRIGSRYLQRTRNFVGNGPGSTYFLADAPVVEGSESVTAAGRPCQKGIDYQLDYQTGKLTLVNAELAASTRGAPIRVSYQVKDLSASSASGRGQALAVRLNASWPKVHLAGTFRQVDPNFTPLEQAGYMRYEKGYDWNLDYHPNDHIQLVSRFQDYRHPYDQYSWEEGDISVRERQDYLALNLSYPKLPRLTISRMTRRKRDDQPLPQINEDYTIDSLRLDYTRSYFNFSADFGRTKTKTRLPVQAGEFVDYVGSLLTNRFNLGYNPSEKFALSYSFASNQVTSSGSYSYRTSAQSSQLAITYQPARRVMVSAHYSLGRTGASSSVSGTPIPATVSDTKSVTVQWNPSAGLSFNMGLDAQLYDGGETSNTRAHGLNFGFWWRASRRLSLHGQYFRQRLRYLGTTGASTNSISSLGIRVSPLRRLTLDLDFQHMVGSTSGSFDPTGGAGSPVNERSKLTSISARLGYPIGDRHELFAQWQLSHNSGYPSTSRKTTANLGWEYAITRNIKASLSLERINYDDQANSRNNYTANLLTGEINSSF